MIYPASLATAEPVPMAIPTLATFKAGASLTPSPVIATICPNLCNSLTMSYFYYGMVLANTISLWDKTRAQSLSVNSYISVPCTTMALGLVTLSFRASHSY